MVVLALAIVLAVAALFCAYVSPKIRAGAISQILAHPTHKNPAWESLSSKFVLLLFLSVLFVIGYFIFSHKLTHFGYLDALAAAPLWAAVLLLAAEELFFRAVIPPGLLGNTGRAMVYGLLLAWPFSPGFLDYLANASVLFAIGMLCSFLVERFGFVFSLSFRLATLAVFFVASVSSSVLLSALIFLAPFVWLALEKKAPRQALSYLGVLPMNTVRLVSDCAWLFLVMLLAVSLVGVVVSHFGFADSENVAEIVRQQGTFALMLAVTLGPIGEELLFRGLLNKKFGIVASSVAFGLAHYFYGSVIEISAAVAVGLLLAWYVKKTNNIIAPIVAHALYNGVSMALILGQAA